MASKSIDTTSIVQGLDSLVNVTVDTNQLTTVVSALVESIRLLNDDVSRMAEGREADQKHTATELAEVAAMVTNEIAKTRTSLEEQSRQEIGAIRAHFESYREGLRVEVNNITAQQTAQFSSLEETLAGLQRESNVTRESDLTRISDLIDTNRSSMQTAFNDLADDVQKNRDAVKLLNDEVLRRDNDSLQHRKRKDEEEARMREEIQSYGREINSLRHYADSLGTDIVSLRTDMNTAMQKQNQYLETKADRDAIGQHYDMLLQHISKGDTDLHAKQDEWAKTVAERFRELEELRTLRETEVVQEFRQLHASRDSIVINIKDVAAETEKLKLDLETRMRDLNVMLTSKAESDLQRLSDLSQHAEQSSDKFREWDKVMDTTTFRLAGLEREVITQGKDIGTVAQEVSALKSMSLHGLGAGGQGTSTSLLYPNSSIPPPGTADRRASFGAHAASGNGSPHEAHEANAHNHNHNHNQTTDGSRAMYPLPPATTGQSSLYVQADQGEQVLLSRLAEREKDREIIRENLTAMRWSNHSNNPAQHVPTGGHAAGGTPLRMGPMGGPPMPSPLQHSHQSPR